MEGMGLEDFETMERVFSASNALASVTRHMSAYRRRLFIDLYFQQWDDDKYENLGVMLYNNYVQALDIIKDDGRRLQEVLDAGMATEADLKEWEVQEKNYIEGLGEELPYDVHAMTYVKHLQQLDQAQYVYRFCINLEANVVQQERL